MLRPREHTGETSKPEPDPAATTGDHRWWQLTTVGDVVTLLAAWLQPAHERLNTMPMAVAKQTHRLRA